MKKIIDRKKYDTATATLVAEYSNGGSSRDFSHYEEALYRKKNGEYFLAGEGGPSSKYSVSAGLNCWSGGENIFPMPMVEALKWAERYMDPDAMEAEFGEIPEGDGTVKVCVTIPENLKEKLETLASKNGSTIAKEIAGIVEKELKEVV